MADIRTDVTIGKVRQRRRLSDSSTRTVARFLTERGVFEADIDRGLHYAKRHGARTVREGFMLAMSRITLSDEQLQAGMRFNFGE